MAPGNVRMDASADVSDVVDMFVGASVIMEEANDCCSWLTKARNDGESVSVI